MDYIGEILNKFYEEENLNYEYENKKFELLMLENELKKNFSVSELMLFTNYQTKLLELKKMQDIYLINYSIKEYMKIKKD